jgi:hypothetical protein
LTYRTFELLVSDVYKSSDQVPSVSFEPFSLALQPEIQSQPLFQFQHLWSFSYPYDAPQLSTHLLQLLPLVPSSPEEIKQVPDENKLQLQRYSCYTNTNIREILSLKKDRKADNFRKVAITPPLNNLS